MRHTRETVLDVIARLGFVGIVEAGSYQVFIQSMVGADPNWLVVRLDEPVLEARLIDALENAGVPRDAVIAALHQAGF
jgi:hypothetical protein